MKEAIDYVKAPENRRKSFGVLMLEVDVYKRQVYACYDVKFVGFDTLVPGLTPFYVSRNEEGRYYIRDWEHNPDEAAYALSLINISSRQPDPVLQQLEVSGSLAVSTNDAFKPVSYTHLDVYKRQEMGEYSSGNFYRSY